MKFEITSRHQEIPAALRVYAESKFSSLERFGEQVEKTEVRLFLERSKHICEVILHRYKGEPLVAHGREATCRQAIDSTAHRLERQLVRFKEKLRDRHRRRRAN